MIETAARGYGPVFDNRRVTEDTLSALYEYDKGLVRDLEDLEKDIKDITDTGAIPEESRIDEIRKKAKSFEKKINMREGVFKDSAHEADNS